MEGKIGGDSALSERGMRYAKALPALITDNIGEASLTVSILLTFDLLPFPLVRAAGVDVNPSADYPDCTASPIPEADLEVS